MFRNAVRVSGKTPLGTDAAVFPHGQNAKESKLMVDLGMAPIEALKFLTAIDAELFGLVQKVGLSKRQAGRYHCNARRSDRGTSTATERVSFVMKEGRVVREGLATPQISAKSATDDFATPAD